MCIIIQSTFLLIPTMITYEEPCIIFSNLKDMNIKMLMHLKHLSETLNDLKRIL